MRVGKPPGPQGPAETSGAEKAKTDAVQGGEKANAAAKVDQKQTTDLKQPELQKSQKGAAAEPVTIAPAELSALAVRLQSVNLGAKGPIEAAPPLTLTIAQAPLELDHLLPPLSGSDVIGLRFAGAAEIPAKLEGAVKELARLADALLDANPVDGNPEAAKLGEFLKDALPDLRKVGNKELAKLAHAIEAKQLANAKQVLTQLHKIFGPMTPELQRAFSRLSPSTLLLMSSLAKKLEDTKKPADAKKAATTTPKDEVELASLRQAIESMPPLSLPRYDELTVLSGERRSAFGGLIENMMKTMQDPIALAELVLLQIRADNQQDLKDALAEMKAINTKKQAQRDFITKMKQERASADRMMRERYDERVKAGEIDPAAFSYEDFKASQQLIVGSDLPGADASEADANVSFVLGEDIDVPPPNTSGEASSAGGAASDPAQTDPATVDMSLLMPLGNTPEQFAAKLNITVDDLRKLCALYNSFPSFVLRGRMGSAGGEEDDRRPDFVSFLTQFNCCDLRAPSEGSQSTKVTEAVAHLKTELAESIEQHAAAEQRRAHRKAETERLMGSFSLSEEDVQFCRLRYGRKEFKDKYATLEDFMLRELHLSKADPGRNTAMVDALRPKTTDMSALVGFAEQFGLSKGVALAVWDMFCARGDRSKSDFGAIPAELFAYLENECGFSELDVDGNEAKINDWITTRAAGQNRLNGSREFDDFRAEITAVGIGADGTLLSAGNSTYREHADDVDRALKSHYDEVLGKGKRENLDDKLFAFFRAMMFESYYRTVESDGDAGKRKAYFAPGEAYDALVAFVKESSKKSDCADYVELRILEFQRDLLASSSGDARRNLGDQFGDVLTEFGKGAAAGAVVSTGALATTGGGVLLAPIVAPIAAIVTGVAFAASGDKIAGNFWSSFVPENGFGNSGTKGWKLEDDREENRYKDAHDGDGHGGMWVENETRDSARQKAVDWIMGTGNTGFGSTYEVKVDGDGKPYIKAGFAMDSRVPNDGGYPTTKFRNDCFEGDEGTMAKGRQDAVALEYVTKLDQGQAYGDSAMRRGMGEAEAEVRQGLSSAEKIANLEAELADAKRRGLSQDAIDKIERKLAREHAKEIAKEKLKEKIEARNAQGHDRSARDFLNESVAIAPTEDVVEGNAAESVGGVRMTIAELDAKIEGWQSEMDSMSETSEAMQLRLQILMDRFQQCAQMLSNIIKKASDSSSTITNNLK